MSFSSTFLDDLDDFLVDNQSVILQSIAEDLRACLPLEAMAPSETMAIQKVCVLDFSYCTRSKAYFSIVDPKEYLNF